MIVHEEKSLLHGTRGRCDRDRLQKHLRDQICQNGDDKKDESDFHQRIEIHVGGGFGEFIRDHAGKGLTRSKE